MHFTGLQTLRGSCKYLTWIVYALQRRKFAVQSCTKFYNSCNSHSIRNYFNWVSTETNKYFLMHFCHLLERSFCNFRSFTTKFEENGHMLIDRYSVLSYTRYFSGFQNEFEEAFLFSLELSLSRGLQFIVISCYMLLCIL